MSSKRIPKAEVIDLDYSYKRDQNVSLYLVSLFRILRDYQVPTQELYDFITQNDVTLNDIYVTVSTILHMTNTSIEDQNFDKILTFLSTHIFYTVPPYFDIFYSKLLDTDSLPDYDFE